MISLDLPADADLERPQTHAVRIGLLSEFIGRSLYFLLQTLTDSRSKAVRLLAVPDKMKVIQTHPLDHHFVTTTVTTTITTSCLYVCVAHTYFEHQGGLIRHTLYNTQNSKQASAASCVCAHVLKSRSHAMFMYRLYASNSAGVHMARAVPAVRRTANRSV